MWGWNLMLLASLLASASGFALPASGLRIRAMAPGDILCASRLLLRAFTEREDVNVVSKALIFAEHVVGLRERHGQNVILVAEQPVVDSDQDEIVGIVEMYTPEFLLSKAPELPGDAVQAVQPYVANLAVSAAVRKQGVGSALMRACEQVCKPSLKNSLIAHLRFG